MFSIVGDDIAEAVARADFYGTTLMQFKLASRYFLIIGDEVVHCFPTNVEDRHMSDFIELLEHNAAG